MIANPKIFKTYDVRGEWNTDWDAEFVYQIGLAIAQQLKPQTVAIGYDMRSSSPIIFEQLSKALVDSGVDVDDLGLCGTELTYFASSFVENIDLAIMITASHNPGKDNGMKITLKSSISLGLDSGLSQIRDLALSDLSAPETEKGAVKKLDLWEPYKEHVFKLAKIENLPNKKIIVDVGNGIGGIMFDKVFGTFPVQKMYWNPDGGFPNHPADPFQEKNVEELKKKVIEEKADLGIAFDGDGDRVFFVDDQGRYLPGYYFAALMTDHMLKQIENPSQEIIVHDPRYYWATQEIIGKYGAKPVPSKVGHTLIKAKMRENNSLFSAECSGHVFYRENNFAESSMLTTLLMLKLISEKPLSEQVDHFFEDYPISGEINFVVEDTNIVLSKLEEKYSAGKVSRLDGISIDFPDWRFNVRSSNTQPLLRLNVEAKDKELLDQKVSELKELIGGRISEH